MIWLYFQSHDSIIHELLIFLFLFFSSFSFSHISGLQNTSVFFLYIVQYAKSLDWLSSLPHYLSMTAVYVNQEHYAPIYIIDN